MSEHSWDEWDRDPEPEQAGVPVAEEEDADEPDVEAHGASSFNRPA